MNKLSKPIALLNTTIATTDGIYTVETITIDKARSLIDGQVIESAIGHQSTADTLSTLLSIHVPMDRKYFEQQCGQMAIVFKLNGRISEGSTLTQKQIDEIGYTLKLMTRIR